ncbi:hypothetical protein CXB51_026021 [Gossypium anomalum]|uniref:protein-histidine N-methyltransferase n=1 Tax=Gossypium anomalum TaxID=47600 RepID=A0A8J5YKZ1_9ROSI|nr:hypothetical protein CXB51_026021 [Gossypium anomalum]
MATNTSFQLFSSSNDKPSLGLGFLESSEPQLPPPPPSVEVLSSEVSSSVKYTVEPVNLDGLTLLKISFLVFAFEFPAHDECIFSVGGLKLWEGSLDLVKALRSEIQNGCLSFEGKRVLEIDVTNVLACLFLQLLAEFLLIVFSLDVVTDFLGYCMSRAEVHFQDFNAEVIRCLTIPNVNANLLEKAKPETVSEVRFFAGDWGEIHQLLPHARESEMNLTSSSEHDQASAYDVILMAETIYSISAQRNLYGLIKKVHEPAKWSCIPGWKEAFFGVVEGEHDNFFPCLREEGVMAATLVTEVADGSSNVREVWKLSYR